MATLSAKYTMDGSNIKLYFPDGSFSGNLIQDGAVTEAKLAAGIATGGAGGAIPDHSITGEKLVLETITHEYIAPLTIISANLQDALVTASKLADSSVSEQKLIDLAVTAGKLASNSVDWQSVVFGDGKPSDNATFGGIETLIESFDTDLALGRWEQIHGTGETSIVTSSSAMFGGKVLHLGNNSGNDEVAVAYNKSIPYDPTKLYKVKVRLKRGAGSATSVYVGLLGRNYDDSQWVDRDGSTSYTAGWCACDNVSPTTNFVEYIGYMKGTSSPGSSTENPSPTSPGRLHDFAKYFRPIILANRVGLTGEVVIDSVIIEAYPTYADGVAIEGLRPAQVNADVTSSNTAANISGQGSLATSNYANWTSQVSGAGKPDNYADVTSSNTSAYVSDAGVTSFLSKSGAGEVFYQAIGNAHMANAAIDSAQIASAAVGAAAIANLAVGTAHIANAAIIDAKVNNLSANKLTTGTLNANRIGTGSIEAVKIAANTISADKIVNNTLTSVQIASNTITASQIAASTITASELAADCITSNKIAAGSINAIDMIASNTIRTSHVSADNINVVNSANSTSGGTVSTSIQPMISVQLNRVYSAQVFCTGTVRFAWDGSGNKNARLYLYRDSNQVWSFGYVNTENNPVLSVAYSVVAGTGNHTFSIRVAGNNSIAWGNITLMVMASYR